MSRCLPGDAAGQCVHMSVSLAADGRRGSLCQVLALAASVPGLCPVALGPCFGCDRQPVVVPVPCRLWVACIYVWILVTR